MATRSFFVENRSFEVEGVSDQDPYLMGISGQFEQKFQDFCRAFLSPDAVVMDIGANIGVTSIILSQYLPKGTIYALEPGKGIFRLLQENLNRNLVSNVRTYNYAVSDQTKTLRFFEHSAYGHIDLGAADCVPGDESAVTAYTIDDLVDELKLDRLDFIKVDVEGFEPQFFEGAKKTLARFKPIIYFELNSWCLMDHAGNNPLDFMRKIANEFHFIYRVSKDTGSAAILEHVRSHNVAETLVHENMVLHGSVDDIVVTNDPSRLHPGVMKLTTECDALRQENQALKANLGVVVAKCDVLRNEASALRAELEAVKRERNEASALRAELEAFKRDMTLVLNSRSWRYTQFIRSLRRQRAHPSRPAGERRLSE